MSEAINYAAHERLRDGKQVEIRALRPEDEATMLAAIERTSAQSLQRRFFVMKRHFSEKERAFFMNVDFKNHVAIVALAKEGDRTVIAGGGRYIVFEPGRAEMAFVVAPADTSSCVETPLKLRPWRRSANLAHRFKFYLNPKGDRL